MPEHSAKIKNTNHRADWSVVFSENDLAGKNTLVRIPSQKRQNTCQILQSQILTAVKKQIMPIKVAEMNSPYCNE